MNTSRIVLAVLLVLGTAHAKPKKLTPPEPKATAFDKGSASAAIAGVELRKCLVPTAPRGEGHVFLTFAPSGEVSVAQVDKGPFVGTPVEKCISAQYMKIKIAAFSGDAVKVGKSFAFGS
jgi:hypothetical protein